MYARVTFAEAPPGQLDETVGLVRETLYPALKEQPGFKGALLLANSDTRKIIGITMWETEADIPHISTMGDTPVEAGAESGPTRRFFEASALERTAMIPLTGQSLRETYEVVDQV